MTDKPITVALGNVTDVEGRVLSELGVLVIDPEGVVAGVLGPETRLTWYIDKRPIYRTTFRQWALAMTIGDPSAYWKSLWKPYDPAAAQVAADDAAPGAD